MDRTNWILNGFLSFKIQNFIHVIQKHDHMTKLDHVTFVLHVHSFDFSLAEFDFLAQPLRFGAAITQG